MIKIGYYYKHKTTGDLLLITGQEPTGRMYLYSYRLSIKYPYWHCFGTPVEDLLENYVEYNP